MGASFLEERIIHCDLSAMEALWRINRLKGTALFVVNESEELVGMVTKKEIDTAAQEQNGFIKVGDFCNKKFIYVVHTSDNEDYEEALKHYNAHPTMFSIPLIDKNGHLVDCFRRDVVCFQEYYNHNKLERMNYAICIYEAAKEAKKLGYDEISVIEFGVAGGNGLLCAERYSEAVERIFGIKIKVYGFDNGIGLPKPIGYQDRPHSWQAGWYQMDIEELSKKLKRSTLVLGDVKDTISDFVEKYHPPRIGVMLCDMDYYSSTTEILSLLQKENEWFVPRVRMYFDDVRPEYEWQGEALAIKEFNSNSDEIKISPEGMNWSYIDNPDRKTLRIKMCHRFSHPNYNSNKSREGDLSLPK